LPNVKLRGAGAADNVGCVPPDLKPARSDRRSKNNQTEVESGKLPFSCPFGATKSSKGLHAQTQSEGRKSTVAPGSDAQSGNV
jgi:hypothetical protein